MRGQKRKRLFSLFSPFHPFYSFFCDTRPYCIYFYYRRVVNTEYKPEKRQQKPHFFLTFAAARDKIILVVGAAKAACFPSDVLCRTGFLFYSVVFVFHQLMRLMFPYSITLLFAAELQELMYSISASKLIRRLRPHIIVGIFPLIAS